MVPQPRQQPTVPQLWLQPELTVKARIRKTSQGFIQLVLGRHASSIPRSFDRLLFTFVFHRDFLLKPELLRAISDLGFEHPSEGEFIYEINE